MLDQREVLGSCIGALQGGGGMGTGARRPDRDLHLEHETGFSLVAAGWVPVGVTKGGQWGTPSRPREVRPAAIAGPKTIWAPKP
jgi:hypothetical protein